MPDVPAFGDTVLEVVSPDGRRRIVRVNKSPFFIGRGGENGTHLQLTDRRISRQCAAITSDGGCYSLEDRGHRYGIFVNGEKIDRRVLEDSDVITFGLNNSYEITFRSSMADTAIEDVLSRIGNISSVLVHK